MSGRNPTYKTAEEMQTKIDEYFDKCLEVSKPPTMSGLALCLGFTSRQTLLNYKAKKAFVDTIKRAKLRVEEYAETRLYDRDGARGAEFNLRTNFGWREEPKDSDSNNGIIEALIKGLNDSKDD